MRSFYKFMARWALAFASLVLILLLSFCASVPSPQKYVSTSLNSETSTQIEESFQALWEKRTVNFGMEMGGKKSFQMGFPFVGGRGRGNGSEFPIQITATLMDSLLIESGIKHHASFVKMTPEEEVEFRSSYYQRYDPSNHLLIWCELQTSWTELYLNLDRWTIFIEDNYGNQYEPARITEESQPIRQSEMDRFSDFLPGQGRRAWESHHKIIMFCFPKFDFYKKPILSDEVKFIKLVFLLSDDQKTRAEGVWVFTD